MSRVLVVGAGLVAAPLVNELLARPGLQLTVAALNVERARELVAPALHAGHGGRALALDVENHEALDRLVAEADAVVSLLPAQLHPRVAEPCVAHGVSLVTTSYVSEAMRAFDAPARSRGVLLLNECGLDPGIDHMMAAEGIRRLERDGGRITSFISYCGGLPAPDSAANPLRYKLSWSPRGVLLAARSPVRFLRDGEEVEHPSPYLPGGADRVEVPGIGELEGYPNRDSLPYRDLYGLADARDVFRGTLRYPGWCETMEALLRLGLLGLDEHAGLGPSYCDLVDRNLPPGPGSVRARVARFLDLPEEHPVLDRLGWLGFFSQQPLPDDSDTPLDVLAHLFEEKLRYGEGERDMVVLEHRFVAEGLGAKTSGSRRIVERLIAYGTAGDDSAMARTVGLPAALACGLVLDGALSATGVQIPVFEEIARPVLAALGERGIELVEASDELPATA